MKKILIVVDMQKGFSRYEQTKKLASDIIELTNSGVFDAIIATKFINREGSLYTRILNWHRLIESPETDLINGLKYDIVRKKYVYTCVDSHFIATLRSINDGIKPTHVFIAGADTDCCVLKIATDLFEKGIWPIVLTDYCNSNGGPKSHEAGKLVLTRLIGKSCLVEGKLSSKEQLDMLLDERKLS